MNSSRQREPPLEAGVGSGLQGRCGGVLAGGASGNEVIGRGRPIWSDLAERWKNAVRWLTDDRRPPHQGCVTGHRYTTSGDATRGARGDQLTPTGSTAVSTWSAEYAMTGSSVP